MTDDFTFGVPANEYVPEAGGGGANILTYIKEDMTQLYFMQEWEDARVVAFHFDKANKVSFPCPGREHRDKCPGCVEGIKPTKRIVIVGMDLKTNYINVWELPISLREALERNIDRDGTLRARPFTIFRSKQGDRTTYDVEREDKYAEGEAPTSDFDLPSIDEALKESWRYGTDESYRNEKKDAAKNKEATTEKKVEEKKFEKGSNVGPKDGATDEDEPPFEEDVPRGEVTESEIRGMSYLALVKVANEEGIDYNDDMSKQELADRIVDALGN